jgi:hypothetical protein
MYSAEPHLPCLWTRGSELQHNLSLVTTHKRYYPAKKREPRGLGLGDGQIVKYSKENNICKNHLLLYVFCHS